MSAQQRLQKYLNVKRIQKLHDKVRSEFLERGPFGHNWDHIYRDTINAIWIGEAEAADMNIVMPAVLLHDIGFLYNPDPMHHHLIGSEKCLDWLNGWNDKEKEKIAACIKSHKGKYPGFDLEPVSLEAQVIHDADMLDKLGWIGVLQSVRNFSEFGQSGIDKFEDCRALHGIVTRNIHMKTAIFHTKTGKELGEKRDQIQNRLKFFEEALVELEAYEE